MTDETQPASCSRCGASIPVSDFTQGLAIRIGGNPVCQVCVDTLPADARLRINQMRALRGMDSQTFRFKRSSHPRQTCFTFSTSAAIMRHRRTLNAGDKFDAPLIGGSKSTAASKDTTNRRRRGVEPKSNRQVLVLSAAGTLAALVVIVLIATSGDEPSPSSVTTDNPNQSTALGTQPSPAQSIDRNELVDDAASAWRQADRMGLASDHPVRSQLTVELRDAWRQAIQRADGLIEIDALEDAERALATVPDLAITGLDSARAEAALVRDRINQRRERAAALAAERAAAERAAAEAEAERQRQAALAAQQNATTSSSASDPEPPTTDDNSDASSSEVPFIIGEGDGDTPVEADGFGAGFGGGFGGGFGEDEPSTPRTDPDDTAPNPDFFAPIDDPDPADAPETPAATEPWQRVATAAEMIPEGGQAGWNLGAAGVVFTADVPGGILTRSVRLPPGRYQVWLEGRRRVEDLASTSRLMVEVGGQDLGRVDLPDQRTYPWLTVPNVLTVVADPEQPEAMRELEIRLVALGNDVAVRGLVIANVGHAAPDTRAPALAEAGVEALDWSPWPAPDLPAVARTRTIDPTAQRSDDDIGDVADLDDLIVLRNASRYATAMIDMPGYAHRRILVAERTRVPGLNSRRLGLSLPLNLPGDDWTGLVVELAPNHPRRDAIAAVVEYADGRTERLPDLVCDQRHWHTTVSQRRQPGAADAPGPVRLWLAEPGNASTTFWVARLAVIYDQPASIDAVERPPRALQPFNPDATADLIREALGNRQPTVRINRFDPNQVQFLIGHQVNTSGWRTGFYAALEPWLGGSLRNVATNLVMFDDWLDRRFIIPEAVRNRQPHLVVVASAGIEFPTGLSVEQAWLNFWRKWMGEAISSGMVPVVVLGPSKVFDHQVADAARLWSILEQDVRNRHPGVPIIDLRHIGSARPDRFGPGQATAMQQQLAQAYGELAERMQRLQEHPSWER